MEEKMIAFYNANAAIYDKEQDEFSFVRVPERGIALGAIKKIAGKTHSVLEIGAGTGRFTLEIAPLVRQITAVDVSRNMLDCMSQKSGDQGVSNLKQICGNFMEITFAEKFDIIISFSAIEYIKEQGKDALFAKISGLLAPGGHLIITTTHNTFFRWWGRLGNYFRQGIFMDAYSKSEMRQLLAANGLEVKELTDLCFKSFFSKGILLFVHATK
jgi:cyclopropane fatty-acyl-phospholipid synthase-like methyltransferase